MKAKIWKIVGLVLIAIFMLSTTVSVQGASLTTTIATGSNPVGVVYDPAMHEVFVSNYQSGDIQVISDSTNQQVADITALTQYAGAPYDMAYDSSKGEIWVADDTGAYAISDATNTIAANVTNINPNWSGLTRIACDPSTGEVFVSYTVYDVPAYPYIAVISDSSNTIIANMTITTTWMVDDSAKSEIFATDYTGTDITAGIYVISAKTNAVTDTITVSGSPEYLAYDSGKGEIFVESGVFDSSTGTDSYVVQVISDSTNKVVSTFNLPTSVTPGPMVYNPNKGEIYINDVTSVAIFSDSTNKLVGTVNTNGSGSGIGEIAYDSGTGTVYAINNGGIPGSVAVISDASGTSASSSPTASSSTSSPTTSATSTPKVPEFSSTALVLILAAMAGATASAVALAAKKPKRIR